MKKLLFAALAAAMASPASALDPIGETGWSGHVDLGVGAGAVESNFLARISGVDIDLGEQTIDRLDSPDDEDVVLPMINFQVGYTFDNGRTRISAGNDFTDFLQFDRMSRLAVRHDFDSIGNLQLALLNSQALQTEVWADPYLTGAPRKDTEFLTQGARLTWDKIFGSNFELKLTAKEREIDDERSGESLNLSEAERKLLDREGDVIRAELGYLVDLGNGSFLRPSFFAVDRDLDGDAMAQDGFGVDLSYVHNFDSGNVRWVTNLRYTTVDGDEENPIFNEANDAESVAFATQLFFPGAFGLENWTPSLRAIWGEEDSDIDFNDTKVWAVGVSMFRTF